MHLDSRKMKNSPANLLRNGLKSFIDLCSDFEQSVKNVNQQLRDKRTLKTSNSKVIASSLLLVLLISAICDVTDACSSRIISRPKPRTTTPAPTSSPRPNITFHTYKCPEAYATWYCLNGATCFAVKIGMEVLYNCECANGFIGPRCDYKDLDGSYLSARSRVMLETASIAGGAVAALLLAFIVGVFVYLRNHNKNCEFEVESQKVNHRHEVIKLQRCENCQISDQFTIVIKYHNG
ncbi:CLUMA_CG002353, isoform A [Clunio marinus]|uniref:CLUMA_CG002353, isoform A n=1 Tax=Clunio marinus TaxID=568069 RepID=A0A1J1HKL5_9DIPT|nr:CLUMA_CG002353, isoform A [Clunio marinus]